MIKRTTRFLAALLCLALLLCLLPACEKKASALAQNGISSLLLNAKTKVVTATVTISEKILQEHKGETLKLYEVLPGASLAVCVTNPPIATQKIAPTTKFVFNLYDGQHSRLYSSFVVALEDGSFLSEQPKRIENPQVMANETYSFTWAGSPKGLYADDVNDSASLGAMHVMYELSFSALVEGNDTFSFGGRSYHYSKAALAELDGKIKSATDAGLQVSLTLIPDYIPTATHAAACFDLLASHYTGGVCGTVSAFFIGASPSLTASKAAQFAALANYALLSRVSNGRVYIVCGETTLSAAKAFFSDVKDSIERNGTFAWGAAVSPALTDEPWQPTETNELGELPLTVSALSSLSTYLFSAGKSGQASYFAVTKLSFSAQDLNRQAAALAYSYRTAVAAKAGLIFYAAHLADDCGLYTADGFSRPAAEIFHTVDTGLSENNEATIASYAGSAWKNLPAPKTTHVSKKGSATLGSSGYTDDVWFDFSSGSTLGFDGIGNLTDPECRDSAALGTKVLYTWLNASTDNEAGVRKLLTDASVLDGMMSLTVKLLTQVPDAETCHIRLNLRGTSTRGALLTHVSEITLPNGSWQTATFQISEFVAEADLSEPCILTLTCEPDVETDEEYVFWLHSIRARRPGESPAPILPIVLILGGTLLSFLGVLLIHSQMQRRRRARRREG